VGERSHALTALANASQWVKCCARCDAHEVVTAVLRRRRR
jgi:hypothetical protein